MYFSISEAISFGWENAKKHIWFFVKVFFFVTLVIFLFNFISENIGGPVGIVVSIVSNFVTILLSMGIIKICLKIYDGESVEVLDVVSQLHVWLKGILANLIIVVIVCLGFICLVVPGIYFLIRFSFVLSLIVDEDVDILDAFRLSSEMTKNVKWRLLGFGILLVCINILGVVCLFIGVFWTSALSCLANVFVYRSLLKRVIVEEHSSIGSELDVSGE